MYSNSFQPKVIMESNVDICFKILDYLDNVELSKCKLVCTFWKEMAEKILSRRVIVVLEKFPKSFLKEAILRPEFLLPYMKFQDRLSTQFIPEFIDNSVRCICNKLQNWDESIGYNLSIESAEYRFRRSLRSIEDIPSSKIAIFPLLSGIQINRFLISKRDLKKKLENDTCNFSKMINVPEEELKCILMFTNGDTNFCDYEKIRPSCALAGFGEFCNDTSEIKVITFSGKRLNAISFFITKMYSGQSSRRKQMKKLNKLKKKSNISQNKCVAFVIGNLCECEMIYMLPLKELFPDVPFLFYTGYKYFGINYTGNLNKNDKVKCFFDETLSAMLVLVWFN